MHKLTCASWQIFRIWNWRSQRNFKWIWMFCSILDDSHHLLLEAYQVAALNSDLTTHLIVPCRTLEDTVIEANRFQLSDVLRRCLPHLEVSDGEGGLQNPITFSALLERLSAIDWCFKMVCRVNLEMGKEHDCCGYIYCWNGKSCPPSYRHVLNLGWVTICFINSFNWYGW